MPRIKIKSMDEKVATMGLHFGGLPEQRKLQPTEVIEFDEDDPLFKAMMDSGKCELTMAPVTRPLIYPDAQLAKFCSPTFKASGPNEQVQVDAAKATIADLLSHTPPAAPDPEPEPVQESPAAEPEAQSEPSVNPRAARRAAAEAANEEDTAGS